MSRGERRWAIGLIALVLVAAAGIVAITRHSGERPVGAAALAVGNKRFARAAAHCHLSAAKDRVAGRPSLLLGLHVSLRLFTGRGQCEEARLAQQTGVRAIREDFSWALAEPHPNRYRWAIADSVVRTATEAGLTVLPVLDDAPGWAAPSSTSLPPTPGAYAAFVAAVVARYGPVGEFWRAHPGLSPHPLIWYELWNEPYDASSYRDPAVYARLVQAAVAAGRRADRSARFLIEAASFYETTSGRRADWISGMFAAVPSLSHDFDGVAVHLYGGNPSIYTPQGDTDDQPGRVEQIHDAFAAHGDGGKPIWVTEIGWSTCAGATDCVTEAQQAAYLRTFLHLARTTWRSYVRAVFVYELRDSAPQPRDNPKAWFGLLRADLSRKPAWRVLRNVAGAVS